MSKRSILVRASQTGNFRWASSSARQDAPGMADEGWLYMGANSAHTERKKTGAGGPQTKAPRRAVVPTRRGVPLDTISSAGREATDDGEKQRRRQLAARGSNQVPTVLRDQHQNRQGENDNNGEKCFRAIGHARTT